MSWTSPRTWVAGAVLTAAQLNVDVRDNSGELRAGGIAIASQAAGDTLYASSSSQLARVAIGTAGQIFAVNSGATAPEWVDNTKTILLPVAGAEVDTTNPPEVIVAAEMIHLAYDDTTDQLARWRFRMPSGYGSSLTLKLLFSMASATTGSVVWQATVWALTAADAVDADTASYDTANVAQVAVPGTAGYLAAGSITMTNADSVAAGDMVTVELRRDADGTNGTDDATGDAELRAVSLEYTGA